MHPPYYLATARGFYATKKALTAKELIESGELCFTGNIRRATPFDNFKEAENCFKLLLEASKETPRLKISSYFAVLTAPSMRMELWDAIMAGEVK